MAKTKPIHQRAIGYRQTIRQMQQMPEAAPASDFTRRAMERIAGRSHLSSTAAYRRHLPWLDELWQWRGPTRWQEFSLCLFAVVFIYVLLGALLHVGFQLLAERSVLPYWIRIQAPYALCTALGLLIVSLYSLTRRRGALRLARSAIIIHLGLAAVLVSMVFRVTNDATLLVGLLSFTSIHLIFGSFMALVVYRFNPVDHNHYHSNSSMTG